MAIAATLVMATGAANASAAGLTGAGSTLVAPLMANWINGFEIKEGIAVKYGAVGSGAGIAQITARTVDFGASDAPLTPEQASACNGCIQVPWALSATGLGFNVPGVKKLNLSGPIIAGIYFGKITKWNDPKIASQNSGVNLPSSTISICHRSDESGTTKNFTAFLADYSDEWKNGPGVDKSVKWPSGTGAKGNDGVAACIKQNENSIGYVEQAYALANNFTFASVKNKAGNFVAPTLAGAAAAGVGLTIPDDLRISTIDAPGAQAYPITALTFLLVYQDVCKAGKDEQGAKRLKAWLDYAEGDGQAVAGELQYAKLPDDLHS
ncbi:MAG TPA: phosphate ABC transporter substrate-binding protein PstS, partial [Solirubrobacterales bacterium]|nr:phosphate ABC transporter substrate-binding protein PstS [Solirubrobacterales bacterium]